MLVDSIKTLNIELLSGYINYLTQITPLGSVCRDSECVRVIIYLVFHRKTMSFFPRTDLIYSDLELTKRKAMLILGFLRKKITVAEGLL